MTRRPIADGGPALSVGARQQIDAIMDTARSHIETVLHREVSRLVMRAQEEARQQALRHRDNAQRVLAGGEGRSAPVQNTGHQPIYVRPARAQQMFGMHRATLYRWADAGHITIHKRGSASFVRVDEVRAFIEGNQP